MQSTSRVLFSKLRIFLAAQRWSLVLVQHLRGRFGLVCSFPLFLLVSMVGCHQDDLLKRAKALQKKPRAGQVRRLPRRCVSRLSHRRAYSP